MRLIVSAQTLNEIAVGTSLLQKKLFAQKVFGSNLSLQNKKIDSVPQKQWVALSATQNFPSGTLLSFELECRYNQARTYLIKNP